MTRNHRPWFSYSWMNDPTLSVHPATRRPMEFKAYQYFGPMVCLQTSLIQGNEFRTSGETSKAKR